jgi:hypothetical protein
MKLHILIKLQILHACNYSWSIYFNTNDPSKYQYLVRVCGNTLKPTGSRRCVSHFNLISYGRVVNKRFWITVILHCALHVNLFPSHSADIFICIAAGTLTYWNHVTCRVYRAFKYHFTLFTPWTKRTSPNYLFRSHQRLEAKWMRHMRKCRESSERHYI